MSIVLEPWRTGWEPADGGAVRELFAAVRRVDRRGPTSSDAVGDNAAVLIARVDGAPAGIAWRHADDPAEVLVHPDCRRRGVGTALVTGVLDVGGGVWAHANLPAAQALADRLGLVSVRELLQLRRSPIGSWPVEPPDGVTLRTFVAGRDEAAFLDVNARAFSWHPEQGRLTLSDLRAEEAADWFDPEGFFLATDADGMLLGFHQTKIHSTDPTPPLDGPADPTPPLDGPADRRRPAQPPDEPSDPSPPAGPIGEVYLVGVDPRSPIRGLGGPLTAAGLNYLQRRRLGTVMLYVESDNEPALKLYRRFGFERYQSDIVYARPSSR